MITQIEMFVCQMEPDGNICIYFFKLTDYKLLFYLVKFYIAYKIKYKFGVFVSIDLVSYRHSMKCNLNSSS